MLPHLAELEVREAELTQRPRIGRRDAPDVAVLDDRLSILLLRVEAVASLEVARFLRLGRPGAARQHRERDQPENHGSVNGAGHLDRSSQLGNYSASAASM